MDNLSREEKDLKEKANAFAKKHKKIIAKEYTDTDIYKPEENPVSIFMAGSPGAGKTEASKRLIETFAHDECVLRIDPDELRGKVPGYKGDNSYLFQNAVTILVSGIRDSAIQNHQSFVFDGTFSREDRARKNIKLSLKKRRFVQILYVYQDPKQAWDFVKKREIVEGRKIKKQDFIDQYFSARKTVNALKIEFGQKIQVDLLVKNIDGSDQYYKENIDCIDNYVSEEYSQEQLKEIL